MEGYKPPFTITNEILSYVSSISEKIGRITATSRLESQPHLRKIIELNLIRRTIPDKPNSRNQRYIKNWSLRNRKGRHRTLA